MAAVRCKRCGAVVSARRVNGDVETSYGADFRAKCRKLSDRLGADFVSTAIECADMAKFIDLATFRIGESAGLNSASITAVGSATANARSGDVTPRALRAPSEP
jgi:hypothetical protein